ncbi:MAG TPA: aldehyde dehydrogenase family protein [Nocardioides sp.]|uniref:aldehyde dehydrogenase family protein n=1 Tax=Nocardioides sp. TaxID=35761 RepID=UPI002CFF3C02|nr:aldehyde dehydrogenase family protein [Nocardioides sp.]HTW15349.1 aldehyde dehydrogenase family protein [Nocardioides sp.]
MSLVRASFIDGSWREGTSATEVVVDDVTDGSELGRYRAAGAQDAADAVECARAAFAPWAATPVAERAALLRRTADVLEGHVEEIAQTAAREIGTPVAQGRVRHGDLAIAVLRDNADQIERLAWEERLGNSLVLREPAGVAVAITAWNFPIYQLCTKVVPALAAGCTVVVKPSELTPLTAVVFVEALVEAGLPAGVANLVIGTGPEVGEALVAHPAVDVVSFTGSTATGVRISQVAAPGVKRVALELGGKSACVLLEDAALDVAVPRFLLGWLNNSGQACAALSRLIVPRSRLAEVEAALLAGLADLRLGDPREEDAVIGPMVSEVQRARVTGYIRTGIEEGARLLTGGPDRPEGFASGHYVRPTVFSDVTSRMTIAQDEIFGPVACVIPVDSDDEAVAVANDTRYGLSGSVWSASPERALAVARRMRTGQVGVNGGAWNIQAPFGGYRHSGIGREGGRYGLDEYLEIKAVQL